MRTLPSLLSVLALVLVACGGDKPAVTPAGPPVDPAPKWEDEEPAAAPSNGSAPAEPQAQTKPRRQRPLALHNACTNPVTVVYGEDHKGTSTTIAPLGDMDGIRDKDGNAVLWLLDENSAPLVSVHVTRGMKRVEVGRSCRSLDAQ